TKPSIRIGCDLNPCTVFRTTLQKRSYLPSLMVATVPTFRVRQSAMEAYHVHLVMAMDAPLPVSLSMNLPVHTRGQSKVKNAALGFGLSRSNKATTTPGFHFAHQTIFRRFILLK